MRKDYFNIWLETFDSGRVLTRASYWPFVAIMYFCMFFLSWLSVWLLKSIDTSIQPSALVPFFIFATHVPIITASVKRAHDAGKSGAWLLIPFYGLVILCLPTKGSESYS